MEFFIGIALVGVSTAAMIWLSPTKAEHGPAYEYGLRPYGGMGSPAGPERCALTW